MNLSELETVTLQSVDRVQIARYAGAVGDFNPVHVDEEFAKASGLPSVIAHGPLSLALALDALVAQLGARRIKSFSARLTQPVFPGDALTVRATADGVTICNQGGVAVATAEVELHSE